MERPETTSFSRQRLPHWEVANGRYFVTIRLKGAIPNDGMRALAARREYLDSLTGDAEILHARRETFAQMEKWLEAAPIRNDLMDERIATIVIESLRDRDARGIWTLYAFTLMPNHIHFFIGPGDPLLVHSSIESGSNIQRQNHLVHAVKTFKRWTATHAARLLTVDGTDFWQREWFDHWSRGGEQDERIKRYIRNNAVKAGLVAQPEDWPYWWERQS